jgi:hypothetical protein
MKKLSRRQNIFYGRPVKKQRQVQEEKVKTDFWLEKCRVKYDEKNMAGANGEIRSGIIRERISARKQPMRAR